jgi:hypothetical protein
VIWELQDSNSVMLRWYDCILAVLAADFIVGFMLSGFAATTWWEPMLYGLLAGMVWQAWNTDYCNFRKKQEKTRK